MLKKYGLEDSKSIKTLMSSKTKLTWDEDENSVDDTKYCGMIGSLLYLTASRPDIMFSVCLCARFQEDPKTSYLEAIKRIFSNIKGTTHLGLWYPKGTGVETIVYAESDHAGDYVGHKSTSGVCTFMRCCLTSWFSKKANCLSYLYHRSRIRVPSEMLPTTLRISSFFGRRISNFPLEGELALSLEGELARRISNFPLQGELAVSLEGELAVSFAR
ncbi:hypothetical protein Tco_0755886 [Tanacetum coccineum]